MAILHRLNQPSPLPRWLTRVLALLGLLAALPGAQPAAARQEQSAIALDVQAGYDGAYRIAEWFPINVNISNDGPDVRAVLEWQFPGQLSENVFQREVDLPRGSRKRVLLNAYSRNFAQNGRLRLLAGQNVLIEQTVRLEAIDPSRFVAGVVSSDPTLLSSLGSLEINNAKVPLRYLNADSLPDQAATLRALDALFIHDVDTSALRPEQRAALVLWTQLGGLLVVSGGLTSAGLAPELRDMLPVELSGSMVSGDLAVLGELAKTTGPNQPQAALSAVTARPGAEVLPSQTPLIYRTRQGSGTVVFTAFDLAALRGWNGEPALWREVIRPGDLFAPATIARQQRNNLLTSVLKLPSLNLPSLWMLLAFMLGYVLVVGPLNYLVLRWLRRPELAWLTIPLAVVLFTSIFYVVGFGLRGSGTQINQVAVVQAAEGQRSGFSTAFIGLFSPRRASYTLNLPPETLVSEARSLTEEAGEPTPVIYREGDVLLNNVLVDVASVRTFMAESVVEVPLRVESAIRVDGRSLVGEVRNTGGNELEDVVVVRGDSFWQLGTLAPGAVGSIKPGSERSFPFGVDLAQVGNFNRQQMLNALFDASNNSRFRRAGSSSRGFDSQGIYLLAWRKAPALGMQVDGSQATQDGLTLYFIRLNS